MVRPIVFLAACAQQARCPGAIPTVDRPHDGDWATWSHEQKRAYMKAAVLPTEAPGRSSLQIVGAVTVFFQAVFAARNRVWAGRRIALAPPAGTAIDVLTLRVAGVGRSELAGAIVVAAAKVRKATIGARIAITKYLGPHTPVMVDDDGMIPTLQHLAFVEVAV